MKNLLLSVVLITALAFVFLACGGDDDPETIDLYVGLNTAQGFWTGEAITPDFPEIEGIEFEWAKADALSNVLESSDSFTPSSPGQYRITATAGDQTDYAEFLVAPAALKNTNYTWFMNRVYTSNVFASTQFNETVEITPTKFALQEVKIGGANGDSFTFTITDWEAQSTRPTFANSFATGFTSGYKVTGTTTATGDYASLSTMTEFYILMGGTNNGQFVRSNGTASTSTITSRYYEKTKSSLGWDIN
jgi:hypothetical protein